MKISAEDLVFLNRQLASMVRLKTPLAEGFGVMARECRDPNFQRLVEEVRQQLTNGKKLSEALAVRPEAFPPTYLALIEAGESSGNLTAALESMADYSQTTMELRSSFFEVCQIPILTLCVAAGVFMLLAVAILPRFMESFVALGVELPPVTLFVLGVSRFISDYLPHLVGAIAALTLCCWGSWTRRALWLDHLLLNLPFIGELLRTAHYTKLCMTLSHLLSNRVPLNQALGLTEKTFRSPIMRAAIQDLKAAVASGGSFAEQCRQSGVFPETMSWKLAFGEQQGTLVEVLAELHGYFLRLFRDRVTRVTFLFAPCLTILVAIVVGIIALSAFLPIFKLQQMLAGG